MVKGMRIARTSRMGECVGSCCSQIAVWTLVILLTSSVQASSGEPGCHRKSVRDAGQWLLSQQHPTTGLLRSYDMPGDTKAWTYDQATGIIALLSVGEVDAARRCADKMLEIRDITFSPWSDGSKPRAWADAYDYATGIVAVKPIAVGPNAWMGLALLRLHRATGQGRYLDAATEIADFVSSLQVSAAGRRRGSIMGGFDENTSPFPWTSTEHNADAIAFMTALSRVTGERKYLNSAVLSARWMNSQMWSRRLRHFFAGYIHDGVINRDYPELLDSQTWTVLAQVAASEHRKWPSSLGARMRRHNGLPWIEKYLCYVSLPDGRKRAVAGFAKATVGLRATPSIWSEGTAGYVLAARTMRHRPLGNKCAKTLRILQNADGSLPCSVGESFPAASGQFRAADIVIDYFERIPNVVFGALSKYGAAAPHSGFYTPETPGWDISNVHTGLQSYRLVNAGSEGYASMAEDLGLRISVNEIAPLDVSSCEKFTFWARTYSPTPATIEVGFREKDPFSDPKYKVNVCVTPGDWQMCSVYLPPTSTLDRTQLVVVSLEFGTDTVGNPQGTVIFVDDFAFIARAPSPDPAPMPDVFAQHWPYPSVAASCWHIFTELNMNPFSCGRK